MNSRFKEILAKGSILLGGSALAQLFTFLSYPILSHWLTSDKWAVFGVFSAVVTVFAVMANGGYEQAILLPKENEKAIALWRLCGRYSIAVSALGAGLLIVKGITHPEWLSEMHFFGGVVAIFCSIYFEGYIISTVVLLNRMELYKVLAKGRAIQAMVTLLLQLLLAFLYSDLPSVLIWGWVAGQGAHYFWLNVHARKVSLAAVKMEVPIRWVAAEYKRFFRFSIVSSYINTLSRQLPFILLPFWVSDIFLGQFTFAHKILSAPLGLIGATITQVFNAQSSKAKRGEAEAIHGLTRQWSKYMLFLGMPVVLALVVYGPDIFEWVFGANYRDAGNMAQWLSPWLFLLYWISPLSSLISTENKLKEHYYYNLVLFVFRAGTLFLLANFYSGETAVQGYCMVGGLFALGMLGWLFSLSKKQRPIEARTTSLDEVTLLFTGDTCFSGQFQTALKERKEIFSDELLVKFKNAQAVCVNFEGAETLMMNNRASGDSVTNAPGSLQYLNIRGVNVFNLANNHIMDEGMNLAKENVRQIYQQGDAPIGLNEMGEWSLTPHYVCFNGITIALLAIEEGDKYWKTALIKSALEDVRRNADYIVLQYHGGEEYSRIPFPFKKRKLQRLLSLDVDVLIAHHPHVAQPLVHQNDKWLAYSLGNFVFDIEEHQGREGVNEGLIIELKINEEGLKCNGIPIHIDAKAAKISISNNAVWESTQRDFYQNSYWHQWAKECHKIRNQEKELTLIRTSKDELTSTATRSSNSKWHSLFNAPRRSLFLGDILYRCIFRFL